MKNYLKLAMSFLILSGLLTLSTIVIKNDIDKYTDKYKNKVGDKIVFKSDTLMIIDYSIIKNTFTLDNGKEISFYLVYQLNIVDE
jgi:hypothetical protein